MISNTIMVDVASTIELCSINNIPVNYHSEKNLGRDLQANGWGQITIQTTDVMGTLPRKQLVKSHSFIVVCITHLVFKIKGIHYNTTSIIFLRTKEGIFYSICRKIFGACGGFCYTSDIVWFVSLDVAKKLCKKSCEKKATKFKMNHKWCKVSLSYFNEVSAFYGSFEAPEQGTLESKIITWNVIWIIYFM